MFATETPTVARHGGTAAAGAYEESTSPFADTTSRTHPRSAMSQSTPFSRGVRGTRAGGAAASARGRWRAAAAAGLPCMGLSGGGGVLRIVADRDRTLLLPMRVDMLGVPYRLPSRCSSLRSLRHTHTCSPRADSSATPAGRIAPAFRDRDPPSRTTFT